MTLLSGELPLTKMCDVRVWIPGTLLGTIVSRFMDKIVSGYFNEDQYSRPTGLRFGRKGRLPCWCLK